MFDRYRRIQEPMPVSFGWLFFISILSSVILIALFKKLSLKNNVLTVQGIPLIGGIGMALAFLIAMFLFLHGSPKGWVKPELWGVVLASMIVLAAGVVDDVKELSVAQKFLIQTLAAFVLIFSGVRTHIFVVGVGLNVLFSFLWIVGITNAVNLLDVMDGLAAAAAIPILLCFSVASFLKNDAITFAVSLTLAGAVLGFLIFNLPPAKVYMGNSGSHFLGLLLAAIALSVHYAPTAEKAIALFSPFLILGFPIFDTLFLVLMRIKKGKSAFSKSNDHLALRYLKQGHSKMKTLALMLAVSFFYVGCGFVLGRVSNAMAVVVLVITVLFSLFIALNMSNVEI